MGNETSKITGFFPKIFSRFFSSASTWVRNLSYILGQKGPVWIDTTKPYLLYNEIPQLKTVIDRKASMFSNMEIKMVDKKTGELIDDKEFYKLIQNPNVLQSMNDWLRQYKIQEQVYGNQFIYKNKPTALMKYPIALWNVSPRWVEPVLTGKIWEQVKVEDIIKEYNYTEIENKKTFEAKDILYTRLNDLDNPIIGLSPLLSLKFPLSNTKLAYQYRNVIMAHKGAIGILSNKSRDVNGSLPMKTEDREKLEKQYREDYGIQDGKMKVAISDADLQWQPMTYPTKDLLLFEEIDANMLTIIDSFGLNINIFSNKNSTYENVKQGILSCYQDTIIPEADQFMQALSEFIGVDERYRLVASYEHLAIMKESKQKGMLTIQSIVTALNQAVQSQLLTADEARIILQNELNLQSENAA